MELGMMKSPDASNSCPSLFRTRSPSRWAPRSCLWHATGCQRRLQIQRSPEYETSSRGTRLSAGSATN